MCGRENSVTERQTTPLLERDSGGEDRRVHGRVVGASVELEKRLRWA